MLEIPVIPDNAPFNTEQRLWLNGYLAGYFARATVPASVAGQAAAAEPREPLLIMFGSQTGTAEGLAKRVAKDAEKRGFAPRVLELNDYEQANLPQGGKVVIISSTWGVGDPPDNAVNFWSWLTTESAPRLENLQFAVLGLGDKNYADFCGASKKFDARLEALGAKRLAPRGECDVDYEAPAKDWIESLWDKLGTNVGQASSLSPSSSNGVVNGSLSSNGAGEMPAPLGSKSNPFPARLLKNVLLNKPGSSKEVRHYEMSLQDSGLTYEVGDALGVVPVNCPELVDDVLEALHATGEEQVKVGDSDLPLREALARHFEITKPSQELLAAVAVASGAPSTASASSGDESQRAEPVLGAPRTSKLAALLAPERRDDLNKWLWGRGAIDLLRLLPEPMPVAEFVKLLRKLSPRLYSISSSPKAHLGEVHLTVSAVRYESHGRGRKGVASTFLADRVGDSDYVKSFVQPSQSFKPPTSGDTPMIMVGPGTGIAPFRAFLEERQATGAKGGNWLFFGDQKRDADFLYEEQLTTWLKDGHLTRLDLAFSRDQAEKIYVQNRMLENAAELWTWLQEGAHFYVCGDASRMAKDVDAALHTVAETAGRLGKDGAAEYVRKLKSEKRYQRDVY